jgi:hypothetical protein
LSSPLADVVLCVAVINNCEHHREIEKSVFRIFQIRTV